MHAFGDQTVDLKVAKGDTLINICKKYLENPSKWPEVGKASRLKNPNIIYPDQVLQIPVGLLRGTPLDSEVTFVKGDAKIQKKDGDEWTVLHLRDKIIQGSTLQTGSESSLEITFEDNSALFLKPNTILGVTTAQKKGLLAIVHDLYLRAGRAITNIKSATGADSRFEINTPSAVASARGTQFRVSLDEKASTRAEVLEGRVMVKGMDTAVEVKQGEGTLVEKGAVPDQPSKLLAPPKIAAYRPIYKDIPLSIKFDETEGTVAIRTALSKDQEGKDVLFENIIKPKESFAVSNITDGSYYLIISSIDGKGLEGPQSDPSIITLKAKPLPPFIQIKEDDAEFIGKSAEFKWLKVKDAAKYHVQIAEDKDYTRIKEEQKDYRTEAYKTGILDYNTYYFRVSSIAEDGYEGGWSNTVTFRLIPPPPAPQLEKPEVDKKSISLKWRNLGEETTYHFQMSDDEIFKTTLIDEKLQKPEITLQRPKDPGTYYVRTSSIDKKGREGDFSAPQSFEIERGFPYMQFGIIGALGILLLLAL
ncbi:MAG: FecR domain-containing protein [Proteobacteria bacterium]|nr:FecR domain-containing protein [Pseudomonadota bacterium]